MGRDTGTNLIKGGNPTLTITFIAQNPTISNHIIATLAFFGLDFVSY
jgi:hypothetical protein